jgi:hypothetical protein
LPPVMSAWSTLHASPLHVFVLSNFSSFIYF